MPRFSAPILRVSLTVLALAGVSACASTTDAAPDKVHLFSEGYLQMVGATEVTATRDAGGWRVTMIKGVPGNWSAPKVHRLDRREAKALEALLADPSSYVDDPGPEPRGPCLDPWSMQIEWTWRSKTHQIDQECGPWGVASRISTLLWPPAP